MRMSESAAPPFGPVGNHLLIATGPPKCAPMNRQRRASAEPSDHTPTEPRSDTPAALFEAGLRLLKTGQRAEAEKCTRQAFALDRNHADSLHLMGMLAFASKQNDLAIEWFAMAIRQNPDVADYFSNLGAVLQQQGRLDEAIKSYDRALVLKP